MNISAKEKKERLAELRNEVKEFHPLLQDLFPYLPRVTRVENTHGQFEKGADFILFREDDALGDIEYTGVIVKTGKITTDIIKIREQILECTTLQRYVVNGKRNINLDEVWVVTNEHISNGAKEKINAEFKSTKIKFIQGVDVIKWIDEHLSNFWSVKNLPIARYLENVVFSVNADSQASSLLPKVAEPIDLHLGFSPIKTKYNSKRRKPVPKTLLELLLKHKVVYIEGEAGSGKTHSIRRAISEICSSPFYEKHKYVPFIINYADFYRDYDLDVSALLESEEFREVSLCLDDDSHVVLFIDGVDELILNSRKIRDELTALLSKFEECKKVSVVLTSRPLNLGNYEDIFPEDSATVEIDRMNVKQMVQMLKTVCKQATISDRLWGDIQESDLFKQLPRNPISTLLLAQLINDNQEDLPSNLTDVYARYIEGVLGGWDIEKGLQSRKEYEFAVSILGTIAEYFIDNDITHIGMEEAQGFFDSYLGKRNTEVVPKDLFEKCLSRSGIILVDHSGRFCFKHRSFAEFLYALRKFNAHDRSFVDERIYSVPWRTIYFFYTGLHKDCVDLLEQMMGIIPEDTSERFWRFVNMPEYLLAGYTTPYEIVERSLPVLFGEIKDLFLDIIKNREDSPLGEMPEMFVLHFFQAVSSSCYSYRYFVNALENCVLEITCDNSLSKEEQAYAVFFISTVYRALKLPNPFDGLLETFDKDLPLQVRLGIFYNTSEVEHHSALLKRNEKWVKHEMKKNPQLNRYVKRLHELPIGKKKENS